MENSTYDIGYYVLNGFHYLFLAALVVLVAVYLVKMFWGASKGSGEMKSHRRSKHKE